VHETRDVAQTITQPLDTAVVIVVPGAVVLEHAGGRISALAVDGAVALEEFLLGRLRCLPLLPRHEQVEVVAHDAEGVDLHEEPPRQPLQEAQKLLLLGVVPPLRLRHQPRDDVVAPEILPHPHPPPASHAREDIT
jgi:hypothetical protein